MNISKRIINIHNSAEVEIFVNDLGTFENYLRIIIIPLTIFIFLVDFGKYRYIDGTF